MRYKGIPLYFALLVRYKGCVLVLQRPMKYKNRR